MAVGSLASIADKLGKAGKPPNTPVAIVQDASLITQKVLTGTLGNIASKAKKEDIRPPAIVIIGEVAGFKARLNGLKKNKRILFTGLSAERFFIEGTYFHLPLIKIVPLEDYAGFDLHLKRIKDFDWVVFTSRYGVEYFFKRLQGLEDDARVLRSSKIAAVGNSTKDRLIDFGIRADLVPKKESSQGLIEEFSKIDIKDKRILLPRSDISDKGLNAALRHLGAKVTAVVAYKNVARDDLPDLDLNVFSEIVFTSPSTLRSFKRRYKKVPKGVKVRCIGDVTLREAKRCRFV